MAKWGKRGWRLTFLRPGRHSFWPGRPFGKMKTVSWGSRAGSASSASSAKKWGSRKPLLSLPSRSSAPKKQGGRSGMYSVKERKQRQPRPRMRRRTFWLIMLLIFMLGSLQTFIFMERNLRPPLMHVAKVRVKQIATQAINQAITDQVAKGASAENLIDWKMNNNGKISGFILNYNEHMKITSETISTVQSTLYDMHKIPERIPIGHALNSAIISSFGPKVPVRFEPVGAAKVELGTREKNAGINMILVEVYIHITAEVSIIIPFDTDAELVETDIPISYLLVVGDVPMYYYDNTGKPIGDSAASAPNISVPLVPGAGISSSTEEENGSSNGQIDGHAPPSQNNGTSSSSTDSSAHNNSGG